MIRTARTPNDQVPGVYRRRVGDIVITTLNDGYLKAGLEVLLNITPEEAQELLQRAGRPARARATINAFAVHVGERVGLIDTGSGATLGPTAGQLQANLAAAGIDPNEIDTVVCGEEIIGRILGEVHDIAPRHLQEVVLCVGNYGAEVGAHQGFHRHPVHRLPRHPAQGADIRSGGPGDIAPLARHAIPPLSVSFSGDQGGLQDQQQLGVLRTARRFALPAGAPRVPCEGAVSGAFLRLGRWTSTTSAHPSHFLRARKAHLPLASHPGLLSERGLACAAAERPAGGTRRGRVGAAVENRRRCWGSGQARRCSR